MPYSYYKLSSISGYGAGNIAPHYFEMMWERMQEGSLAELPHHYLSMVAGSMRKNGTHRSTAEVIEAVRLAALTGRSPDTSGFAGCGPDTAWARRTCGRG